MKIKIFLTVFCLALISTAYSGNPVSGVEVYIENTKKNESIIFQKTGDNGTLAISQLTKGTYHVIVVLPKQSGKLAHKGKSATSNVKVGYHSAKRMYFIQEKQGNFILSFTDLKRIVNSNISPMYELQKKKGEASRIIVGKFEVKGGSAGFELKVEALKDKKFNKTIEKYSQDSSMATIKH